MTGVNPVIDVSILAADLRLAVEYASKAGLLRDRQVLDAIQAAQQTTNQTGPQTDVYTITSALNAVAQTIDPMTIADLRFGRDPFSDANQQRSKRLQFWLTFFCLVILFLIGYSMNALRIEQGVIASLNELQDLHPELKLTALRMIAERDEPISKRTALFEEYHQKVGELKQINGKMALTYTRALEADNIPLFPLGTYLDHPFSKFRPSLAASTPYLSSTPAIPPEANSAASPPRPELETPVKLPISGPGDRSPGRTNDSNEVTVEAQELCAEDSEGGGLKVPKEAVHYPKWMRTVLSDTLSDFCFQLKVLSSDGQGTILNQAMDQLTFVNHIKDKVSLRVSWFLPFLYGLLGSAVFMMRNAASVRTPVMEWFPIVMRLSLGGVAGIVMGWFSVSPSPVIQNTTSLSLPFALAFLTGYGIDALFTFLDRLNRAIGDIPKNKP